MKKKTTVGSFFTMKTVITGTILLLVVISAIFAPALAPYDPNQVDTSAIYSSFLSPGHLLGTDQLGRDLLSRLIVGARSSLLDAILIVAFEVVIGVPVGFLCGYYGGLLDAIVMRIWDVVCSIPSLLLAFVFIAAFGKGDMTSVLATGIAFIPLTAKMARGLMLTEKKAVYVEALKSIGYSDMRIIFVHIMPNVVATMIAQFTMDIGAAIVAMASLSYLGVGIQPPDADWGSLLQDGMNSFSNNMILLAAPAILIMIVSISINLFSDGIQQYLDPSERKLPTFRQFEKRLLRMEFKGKTQECKAA